MGDAGLSSILQVILQTLVSLSIEEIQRQRDLHDGLEMLRTTAKILRLGKERHVSLVEDELQALLEEAFTIRARFNTEVQRRSSLKNKRVRDALTPLNPRRIIFGRNLAKDIGQFNTKLKNVIGLHTMIPPQTNWSGESSTSMIEVSSIRGRNNDIEAIVGLLTSNENSTARTSVLPILGTAGIGKSTLAREIFYDERIHDHFKMRSWAHVSRDFDAVRVTRSIISSIDKTPPASLENWELEQLQRGLRKRLEGNRYLIVLDDMWTERVSDWENLKKCFDREKESWILVTTRSADVAEIVGTRNPHQLDLLLEDDCLSIFSDHAFSSDDNDTRSGNIETLRQIARQIARKCNGLPLAAKELGDKLRVCDSVEKWESVLNGDVKEIISEIALTPRQSYDQLPSDKRRCFKYCSIFPRGHIFEKDILILLWMAQGCIQGQERRRIEDVGEECFTYLLRRSFFYRCPYNHSKFLMYDLLHDLAKDVSDEGICITEDVTPAFPEAVKHATVVCKYSIQNPSSSAKHSPSPQSYIQSAYIYKNLCTLLLLGNPTSCSSQDVEDICNNHRRLQALDLSNCCFPILTNSVSKLTSLTYLNLSNTGIERLPDSLNKLYKLQTLLLRNCYQLTYLPKTIESLCDLRHFDLSLDADFRDLSDQCPNNSMLKSMPDGLEKHDQLQTLSRFVVSEKKKSGGFIPLMNLNELRGDLCISNLHKILSDKEAASGNLREKKYITRLKLQWASSNDSEKHMSGNPEAVLEVLRPHQVLKELWIEGYNGFKLSTWVENLTNLIKLNLSNCKYCKLLPSLGRLRFLKYLCLSKMYGIESVDCKFCGENVGTSFPSLQRLEFTSIIGWRTWEGHGECVLPKLEELIIKDCPKLWLLSHQLLPRATLTIENCPALVAVSSLPIHHLDVRACGEWMWTLWDSFPSLKSLTLATESSLATYLIASTEHPERLEEQHSAKIRSLPEGLYSLSALQELKLHDCEQLESLSGLSKLGKLEFLALSNCPRLSSLSQNDYPQSLQMLTIENCPTLKQTCNKYEGTDWSKIAKSLVVYMDGVCIFETA